MHVPKFESPRDVTLISRIDQSQRSVAAQLNLSSRGALRESTLVDRRAPTLIALGVDYYGAPAPPPPPQCKVIARSRARVAAHAVHTLSASTVGDDS